MTEKEKRAITIQSACAEVIKVHNKREYEVTAICAKYKVDSTHIKRIIFGKQSI